MQVWVVEGMEATYSDVLGVYDSKEKAQKKKDIEEDIADYGHIVIHEFELNDME